MKPKKAGYAFIGWFVGDIKVTKLSKNVAVCKGDIVVEARFAKKATINKAAPMPTGSCKITYNLNGGIVTEKGQENMNATYLPGVTSKLPKPKKSGYKFLGWFVGDTKVTKLNYKVNVCDGKDIVVEAKWAPREYTVKFKKNGGIGKMPKYTMFYDVEAALPACTMQGNGLVFGGWNTKKDLSGYQYNDRQVVKNLKKTGQITLYATWKMPDTTKKETMNSVSDNTVSQNKLN